MPFKRIVHIDVWRLIAVMLVIQEHFLLFSGVDQYWLAIQAYSLQIERMGELGVLIFFSISGFVICNGLNSEKTISGRICLSAFCVRRFFRIVPPLWLYLACLALLNAFDKVIISGFQVLKAAAFLCNLPLENGCTWFAGHTWSLAYEEQFYLLFPLLFLWAWRGIKNLRLLMAIMVLLVVALILKFAQQPFWVDYCIYFLFLLVGCFTALLPKNYMQYLRALPFIIWLGVVVLQMGLVWLIPNNQDVILKMLLYPLLIQLIVFGTPTRLLWVKYFFENKALSYLGRISYSVYLWQQLATAYYENTLWWQTVIYLGIVFGFASLSFHYFEMPCLRLGTDISNRLKQSRSFLSN